MKNKLAQWAQIVRAQYLTLPIVLSIIGNAYSYYKGSFSWPTAILAFFGLTIAHMSVNVINDYFDFKSGIDLKTIRSPFNGGSGSIVEGLIRPKTALWIGLILLFLAASIGLYFIITVHWSLLWLLMMAVFFVLLYSPVILKIPLAEWSAGLGLGALPVIGTVFVQLGAYSWEMILLSIPSAILVHNLLLLNEIPDQEADQIAHRKTFPILFGKIATIQYYFILSLILYAFISAGISFHVFPLISLLVFITAPMIFKIQHAAANEINEVSLMKILPMNVMHIHLFQLLFGLSFLLDAWFF